jgi:hypothetical protein
VDYKAITQANLDRQSFISPTLLHNHLPLSLQATTSSHPSHFSLVAMFRRSIKKDPSLFPVLKDDKYHDAWHHSFNTQLVAQYVADILDETYVPTTVDGIAFFSEKQKCVYAVLKSKVQTDFTKGVEEA